MSGYVWKFLIFPEQCPPLNDPLNGELTIEVVEGYFSARYRCYGGRTIIPKESSLRSCYSKASYLDKGVLYGKNEWTGTDPVCFGKKNMIHKGNIFSFIWFISSKTYRIVKHFRLVWF